MKCTECGSTAQVVYRGFSLCKNHYFVYFIDYQYNKALTAKKLKEYTKLKDIPTKDDIIQTYYPEFVLRFGEINYGS